MTLSDAERREIRELGLDPDDPGLMDALLERQATDIEWIARIAHEYPLVTEVLWRNPAATCDQRRAVAGVMGAPIVGLILGGWASGKSRGLRALTVAYSLGEDHPAVQAWLQINDLPTGVIPPGPSQVYAINATNADSRKYMRPLFDQYYHPAQMRWSGKDALTEALLEITVPGTSVKGKIWFKSIQQGRKAFQGIEIPWWWVDEEPLDLDGYEVCDELKARSLRVGGRGGISMIPKEGLTWVYDRWVVGDKDGPKDHARVFYLDSADNPHTNQEGLKLLFSGNTTDELAANRYGRFVAKTGQVYDLWDPAVHVCDPFEIPADWPRFRGADFGLVNPTSVHWYAIGNDDTLYVYREHYGAGMTYQQHGEAVKAKSAGETYQGSWGDPSAAEVMEGEWAAMDLYFDLANREVKHGIDIVRNRLRIRDDGRPRLVVFRTCQNLIREFPGYVWDQSRKGDSPVKKNDHALDDLRYAATGIEHDYYGR